jgi:hypothetical protein
MKLATLFIIVYIATVIIFLLMPKRGFDNLIKRDMDKDFNIEDKRFVSRNISYWRAVILGGGIVAAVFTFFIKIILY